MASCRRNWGSDVRPHVWPRDFGGPIVAAGVKLQMGADDTIKLELYEGGEPVTELSQSNGSIGNVVSIPTAISFAINNNGSQRPDGDW